MVQQNIPSYCNLISITSLFRFMFYMLCRKLVFHPNGNKSKNRVGKHVSVYQIIANATPLAPTGWEVDVGFRLFMLDHNNEDYFVLQGLFLHLPNFFFYT